VVPSQGREDLRLDERVMQVLRVANALMDACPAAAARGLRLRDFGVVPLGTRMGLISWVRAASPLFKVFAAWQRRRDAARGAAR
jgi:serine/threonine-protein kinase SMG1